MHPGKNCEIKKLEFLLQHTPRLSKLCGIKVTFSEEKTVKFHANNKRSERSQFKTKSLTSGNTTISAILPPCVNF